MARIRKSEFAYDAFTLEGSLISPAKLAEVAIHKAEKQSEADYLIPRGLTLRDELARYFRIGQALFQELFSTPAPGRQATTRFTLALLRDVLGFHDIAELRAPHTKDNRAFPITFEALSGRVPVVAVPPADDLDHASPSLSHDRRRSAASALQDWLNAEDAALWGLATNGERLRLLRDNESLTRPAYLEVNLRQIFEAEDFAGFTVLWLILHATRFGQPGTSATDCILEQWRESGAKQGLTARNRLSDGVTQALLALGNGFLSHPENVTLRQYAASESGGLQNYFQELLRLVYRLIFLLVAEDRDLLHPPDADAQTRALYAEGYSLSSLRDRAIRRSGWDSFHDRWEGLQIVLRALAHGEPRLALSALGGLFESGNTPHLDDARLSNRALMEAIFRLAWLRDGSSLVRVNWRDMETEELGSVYEGLLELTPRLTSDGYGFAFAEGAETKGNARKTSGSYYTPDSLVQALLDSALDPVLNRVESEAEDIPAALLSVTVIDPACGSGHFLLAAARRIATRVAHARTGGVPSAADYRHALRDVVRSSIHGVDRNPMAVELSRVALWIETVDPGKPLGFLDANIKTGDSLLGLFSLDALTEGIPDAAYKPLAGDDKTVASDFMKRNKRIRDKRTGMLNLSGANRPIKALAASFQAVRNAPEETPEDVASRHAQYSAAKNDPRLTQLEAAAQIYIAAFLTPKTKDTSLDYETSPVPTTEDVWKVSEARTIHGPRYGKAIGLARAANAFHWPLEFPDVFAHGGFDAVLGNPPWERIKLQEQEFFGAREPEIAAAPNAAARGKMIQALKNAQPGTRDRLLYEEFESAKRLAEASSEFARVSNEQHGRFPLTGRGDVNTYALFAELFTNLTSQRGRAGVIVPTGVATDATTAPFFASLVENQRLASLIDFENRDAIFPSVHRSYKFSLLTIGHGITEANFAFFLTDMTQLAQQERRFTLSSAQILRINPNTKTAPIFRTRYDANFTAKVHSIFPPLVLDADEQDGNPWALTFHARLWHMAEDSHWFLTADQLDENGSAQFSPVYEAKMIHQFDYRWSTYSDGISHDVALSQKQNPNFEPTPRYWVPAGEMSARLAGMGWQKAWMMGWRKIGRSTDERSVIASVLPTAAAGDSLPLMFPTQPSRLVAALLGNLSALILDYLGRQKLGGVNLTVGFLKQLPVFPPSAYDEEALSFIAPRVLELTYTSHSMAGFARDLGYDGPPFAWDEARRAQLRAELDAWYARAYGLTRDELRYILDPADVMGAEYPSETFRVLKNNEMKQYKEYRTQKLVLDAWDRIERGDLPCPQPYQALPQVAAQPATPAQQNLLTLNPLLAAGPLFESIEPTPVTPPAYVDPSTLPNGAWTMPNYNSISVQLLLAAILKKLPGPTSGKKARLAALYALRPDYLTPRLSGIDLSDWQRLVGDSARISGAANVTRFIPRNNIEWRDAYTQLRGMRALIEDSANGTWAPGSVVHDFLTEGWPDGRAGFVLKAMEGMEIERSIAALPDADAQALVIGYAA